MKPTDLAARIAQHDAETRAFLAGIRRSAALVKGQPAWTQAGLELSRIFVGGHPDWCICRPCVWREP